MIEEKIHCGTSFFWSLVQNDMFSVDEKIVVRYDRWTQTVEQSSKWQNFSQHTRKQKFSTWWWSFAHWWVMTTKTRTLIDCIGTQRLGIDWSRLSAEQIDHQGSSSGRYATLETSVLFYSCFSVSFKVNHILAWSFIRSLWPIEWNGTIELTEHWWKMHCWSNSNR